MVNKTKIQAFVAKLIPYRLWVQAGFLMVWLDPLKLRMHSFCSPVFHCYACPLATFACPIGIIAQFSALHLFPFMVVGLLLLLGSLLGAVICGWLCPFGLLQDLTARIPTPKLKIPAWLGGGRYVMLVGTVILIPYLWGEGHPLFVCQICPAGGLEKAVPDMVTAASQGQPIPWPNALKLGIIVTFLIAIVFTVRPWCRILCPLGAIYGLCNRFSVLRLDLKEHQCTDCKRCRTLCDYGIQPDQTPNSDQCLRCLECTQCGPGALQTSHLFASQETTKNQENT